MSGTTRLSLCSETYCNPGDARTGNPCRAQRAARHPVSDPMGQGVLKAFLRASTAREIPISNNIRAHTDPGAQDYGKRGGPTGKTFLPVVISRAAGDDVADGDDEFCFPILLHCCAHAALGPIACLRACVAWHRRNTPVPPVITTRPQALFRQQHAPLRLAVR